MTRLDNQDKSKSNAELMKKIAKANEGLDKVSLLIRGNRLYLQATLPDKNGGKRRQQQISVAGLSDIGLRVAIAKAKQLDHDIAMKVFSWGDWIDTKQPDATLQKPAQYWIKEFENRHWLKREKTKTTLENYKKDYASVFKHLDQSSELTEQQIILVVTKYPVSSRQRNRSIKACKPLAKLANITVDWDAIKDTYHPPIRELPTDELIIKTVDAIKSNWQWIAGMLATYGLRPHELFHCTIESNYPYVVRIGKNTKTRDRIILPCPIEWVDRWQLTNVRLPNFKATTETHTNTQLGGKITSNLKKRGVTWRAYDFRDCYAIRLAKVGYPEAIAAKLAGHSEKIRSQNYLKHMSQADILEVFERLNK